MSKKILSFLSIILLMLFITSCTTMINSSNTTNSNASVEPTLQPTIPTTDSPSSVNSSITIETSTPTEVETTTNTNTTTPTVIPSTIVTQPTTVPTTVIPTEIPTTAVPSISVTTPTVEPTPESLEYMVYYGDTLLDKFSVNKGEIVNLTTPSLNGYTFKGFYLDKNLTILCETSFIALESLIIYTDFTKDPVYYTVKFISNNETYKEESILENETVDMPTNPTLDGYDFIGWYTDNTYTTQFDFTSKITCETTLYAKFTLKASETCKVTFIVNGSDYKAVTVTIGTTVSRPENPQVDGYEFVGWYTDTNYTTEFSFTSKITSAISIYAKLNKIENNESGINMISYSGNLENISLEFDVLSNLTSASNYSVYYMSSTSSSYTLIDSELVRLVDGIIRCDIVGLKQGTYSVKIVASDNTTKIINNINVQAYDRSGYAHFNYTSGVGAYTDEGTLKNNAIVVYVTEENKNTVTATLNGKTYTGLINILTNQSKSSVPLNIRIIGTIGAATWNELTNSAYSVATTTTIKGANGKYLALQNYTEDQIISGGFNTLNTKVTSKLNGLTNKVKYDSGKTEFDSYYNMADISNAKNVTVEGIGANAMIFQWGFTWKSCTGIEVRNLTFDDYTEDACSFEGSSSDVTKYGRYWIHNNTFNQGKNYWDVCSEQDKHYGDGAMDLKCLKGVTASYNQFYQCKKTGLVGGSDSVLTMDVTFHHNYYNQVGSRLPLGRQANMHIYNNYYYKCSTCQDIRANAFVLSEKNYFEGCSAAQKVTTNDKYKYTVIKSFEDYITGGGTTQATIVTKRDATLTGGCKPDGSTNYTNFDIDPSKFYYDSTNKVSDVSILTPVQDVPEFVKKSAGAMTSTFIPTYGDITFGDNTGDESGNTGGDSENTETEVTGSILINFNNISTGSHTSNIIGDNYTVYATSSKTVSITSASGALNVNGTSIDSYLGLGGSGSSSYRNISFTTTKSAKITVYYAAASNRYLGLYNSSGLIETSLATVDNNTILSHTYSTVDAGSYYIASTGSGINVYCILIEYTK